MANSYAPLRFLKQIKNEFGPQESILHALLDGMNRTVPGFNGWDENRFIQSFNRLDDGRYQKDKDVELLRQLFLKTAPYILLSINLSPEDLKKGNRDAIVEWSDVYMLPILMETWSKNKQVFKPDPDFADALLHTEHLQYTEDMLKHLPCRTFYIDLEDCGLFSDIHGLLIHVQEEENGVHINMILMTVSDDDKEDILTFSHYSHGVFDKNGYIQIDLSEFGKMDYEYWSPAGHEKAMSRLNKMQKRTLPFLLGYQMIAYLSLEKPELTENPVTKTTYRPRKPGEPVRDKFSEIQIRDVGIRYGKDFRKTIQEMKEKKPAENKKSNKPVHSVRPHFHCAHWHYHRIGKGRKELKLMWHEPTFVMGNVKNAETDVVIHKVSSEKERKNI